MKGKSYSIRRSSFQYNLWKIRPPSFSQLDLELTERCNNDCIHCYINLPANDVDAKEKELTCLEIGGILEEAASLGCLTVRMTGGEPLLRDDFEDIYQFARNLGLRVVIVTNGTLITPRLVELFLKIPPLNKIIISVYGLDQESYEAVTRTPGSYAAFRNGIDLLAGHRIPFEVRASLLPIEAGKMQEFETWANTLPGMDVPLAPVLALYSRCRGGEDEKSERIRSLRLPPGQLLEIIARKPGDYAEGLIRFCASFCSIPGDTLFRCNSGIERGSVDAYGKFAPCLLLRHPDVLYNLRSGCLRDALVNFFPKLRKMKAKDPTYLERCARCFLRSLCDQCPATSWLENRTLDGWISYACEFTHAQARFLGLLHGNERSWEVLDWQERVKRLSKAVIGKNALAFDKDK